MFIHSATINFQSIVGAMVCNTLKANIVIMTLFRRRISVYATTVSFITLVPRHFDTLAQCHGVNPKLTVCFQHRFDIEPTYVIFLILGQRHFDAVLLAGVPLRH